MGTAERKWTLLDVLPGTNRCIENPGSQCTCFSFRLGPPQEGRVFAPASSKQRTRDWLDLGKLSVTAFTISVLLQKTYMITAQNGTTLRYDFFLITGEIGELGCPK